MLRRARQPIRQNLAIHQLERLERRRIVGAKASQVLVLWVTSHNTRLIVPRDIDLAVRHDRRRHVASRVFDLPQDVHSGLEIPRRRNVHARRRVVAMRRPTPLGPVLQADFPRGDVTQNLSGRIELRRSGLYRSLVAPPTRR